MSTAATNGEAARASDAENVLRAAALADPSGRLRHGFSRELGTPDEHTRFARAAGMGGLRVVRLRQVHGATVVDAVDACNAAERIAGDALVSDRTGVALSVATADCVPVLLADLEASVVAAVHAGWRGMRARVVPRAIEAMVERGAVAARIRAAIGPAVQGPCYEVGDEVLNEFRTAFGRDALRLFDGPRLDLVRAARDELQRLGIGADSVTVLADCTHCRPDLASHRRQGPDRGTNLAVIALTAEP